MPRNTPQRVSCRGRSFATAFYSPATAPAFLRLHSGVNVPGLLLHHLSEASTARSAFRSTADPGLRPRSVASPRTARCRFPFGSGLPLLRPPLPFGTVTIPLDQSVLPVGCLPTRLPIPPDLRSLPAAANLSLETIGCGSPFPVRYGFGGLLFLKPLGTSLTMLPNASSVNPFSVLSGAISSENMWHRFNWLRASSRGIAVDKTRPSGSVAETYSYFRIMPESVASHMFFSSTTASTTRFATAR